ncbi:MAG: hypothetical protein E2O42_02765 [Nitrospina sp.]|nr:MAG: hypothetical protein E2O42_02765 [Nitrospina sp.]
MPDTPAPDPHPRFSDRWTNLLILVLLASAGLFMASISWLKWPDLLIDYGDQVYIPWRLSEGLVLYKDIFYTYGPLSSYIHALLFKMFGPGIDVLIGFNLLIVAGLTGLIYFLFKKLSNPLTAFFCSFVFITLFAFGQYQGGGNFNFICAYVYSLPHGVALSFLALFLFLGFLNNPFPKYLVLTGGVAGFVYLTKMEVFYALAFSLFSGLLSSWYQRRPKRLEAVREALFMLAGFLIPVFFFYAYFLTQMPLKETLQIVPNPFLFLDDVAALKSLHLSQWILGFDQPLFNLLKLLQYFFVLVSVLGFVIGIGLLLSGPLRHLKPLPLFFLIALAAAMFVGFKEIPWLYLGRPLPLLCLLSTGYYAYRLFQATNESRRSNNDLFLMVFSVFCTLLLLKIFLNAHIFHYGFALALPATLLMIHMLLFVIPEYLKTLKIPPGFYQQAALVLVLFFVGGHLQIEYQVYQFKTLPVSQGRNLLLDYDPDLDKRGVIVNQTLDYLDRKLKPGIPIATVPYGSMINYLSRHPHPLPYLNFNPFTVALIGEQGYLQSLQKTSSPYILLVDVDSSILGARYFGQDYAQDSFQWIQQNYEIEKQFGAEPFSGQGFGIQLLKKSPPLLNND